MTTSRVHKREAVLLHTKYSHVEFIDLYEISFSGARLMIDDDGRHYKCDSEDIVSDMCMMMWRTVFSTEPIE